MSTFAPKKRFSQNFLTDPGTASRIVAAVEAVEGDHVIEIGPGTGVLTQRLLGGPLSRLVAVDIDQRAIDHVVAQPWAKNDRFRALHSDILKVDPATVWPGVSGHRVKVIGNIPYAITSDILFWLFDHRRTISRAVIMMQREVARRCVGQPGTKEYGILAVATAFAARAKVLFHVQPGSFFPRPDVTSSVVLFEFREADPFDVDMATYMNFVRAAFSQRRKVLANSLAEWCGRTLGVSIRDLAREGGPFDLARTRAEELSPEELYRCWKHLVDKAGRA